MGVFYSIVKEQGILFSSYHASRRIVHYNYTIHAGHYKYYYNIYQQLVGLTIEKNNAHHLIIVRSEYNDQNTIPMILDYNRVSEVSPELLISYDENTREYRSYPFGYNIVNCCIEAAEGINIEDLPKKSKPMLKFKKFYKHFPIYKFSDIVNMNS